MGESSEGFCKFQLYKKKTDLRDKEGKKTYGSCIKGIP